MFLAIAPGIASGLELGKNAEAALITRGLAELLRLGKSLGAEHETLIGLSGLGDLILTSSSDLSRNRRFGIALGRGAGPEEALQQIQQVVEGYTNTAHFFELSKKLNVDMPILEQIYQILYQNKQPQNAVHDLMSRERRDEYHP